MAQGIGKKNPVAITVDVLASGAIKQIKKLSGALKGVGIGASVGVAGIGVLGAAMGVATSAAIKHASKLELIQNKTKIVFGDQLGLIQDWSQKTAQSFGLTAVNLEGMGAGFADLLIPMGFARDEAAQMTMKVVGLAGAMSEWSAGTRTVEDTTRILARAMLGEREMLKDLGVDIRELDITQRLASKGQEELTGNFLKQARAVATMEMIFERSKDAQAGFANGAESLTRKLREMAARFQEMVQSIQIQLTPSFLELADTITKELIPKIEKDLFPILKTFFDNFAEFLPKAIDIFLDSVTLLEGGILRVKFAMHLANEGAEEMESWLKKDFFGKSALVAGPTLYTALQDALDATNGAWKNLLITEEAWDANGLTVAFSAARRATALFEMAFASDEAKKAADDLINSFLTLDEIDNLLKEDEYEMALAKAFEEIAIKASDATDEVDRTAHSLKKLAAEQYATAVASNILASSFGQDMIQFDDMYDSAVQHLRMFLSPDQEGSLEALKRQLMKAAGFDTVDFISSGNRSGGSGGSGARSSEDDGSWHPGFDERVSFPQVAQVLEKTGKIMTKFNMGLQEKGMAHFAVDLDKMTRYDSNLGSARFSARTNRPNEEGPHTIGEAIDKAFMNFVEQNPSLSRHEIETLAASMKAQAAQQKIFSDQLGWVINSNQPNASTEGFFTGTNPASGKPMRPFDEVPGQPPQIFQTGAIQINGVITQEVVTEFVEALVGSSIPKQPGMLDAMFGVSQL